MTERDADMGVGDGVAHGRTYTAEEVARLASNGADLLIVRRARRRLLRVHAPRRSFGVDAARGRGRQRHVQGHRGHEDVVAQADGAHGERRARAQCRRVFDAHTARGRHDDDATAASETGAESDGPFARVRARRAQLVMHTGAEGADTAVDDEKGEGGIRSGLGSTVDTDASSSDLDPSGSEEDEREPGDTSGVDLPGKHHLDTSDTTDFGIDRTRALVHQVGSLGTRYHEWVHTPEVSDAPLRFFENDWAEVSLFYFSYGQLV